jgi:ribose transport system permease protein
MLAVLGVTTGIVALANERFLSAENLHNVGRLVGLHGILTLAAGVVMVAGGIDLSIGSVVALSGLVFVLALRSWEAPRMVAFAAALASAGTVGLIQGALIAYARLQPFIVTLCGLLVVRGLARFVTEDQSQGLGAGDPILTGLVEGSVLRFPPTLWILAGLALLVGALLHGTVLGRHLIAMGSNEEATRRAGVAVARNKVIVYVLGAVVAGLGGVLFVIYTNTLQPANAGQGYELYAIAAAVLGGVSLRGGSGTVAGMLVGCALIRVLVNATNLMRVPTYLDHAVVGAAILAGVLADEFGRRIQSRASSH